MSIFMQKWLNVKMSTLYTSGYKCQNYTQVANRSNMSALYSSG
jgi:hypothetical protein